MTHAKYRSHATSLSDDELLILDVMFRHGVTITMLRRCNFVSQFAAESHSLDDDALQDTLQRLVQNDVIERSDDQSCGHCYYDMTRRGGELWSAERCPIWERYCTDSYPMNIRGRTLVTVKAVSAEIRDDFLRIWPENSARCRHALIRDVGLIHWYPFEQLHVGFAAYSEDRCPERPSHEELELWQEKRLHHWRRVEEERTWWRSVAELQKFIER